MNKLKIAVSQLPVSNDIHKNEKYIEKHILRAAKKQADIIHFPETALSGYETDIKGINWSLLDDSLNRISILANKYNIYIILGIHQKQPDNSKPLDSVLIISDQGRICGSYSKTKLYGNEMKRFSCNNNFHIEEIKNVKCGF